MACHRFEGLGSYSGPSIGSVVNLYSLRDILALFFEPSHSLSEQYQASAATLNEGQSVYGRIIYKNERDIAIAPNPYSLSDLSKIPSEIVMKVEAPQVSMMPAGTVFGMNKDELMDLVAYLVSAGDREREVFK